MLIITGISLSLYCLVQCFISNSDQKILISDSPVAWTDIPPTFFRFTSLILLPAIAHLRIFTSCSFYASYFTILKPTIWLFHFPIDMVHRMEFFSGNPFLNVSPASFDKSKIMNKKEEEENHFHPPFLLRPALFQGRKVMDSWNETTMARRKRSTPLLMKELPVGRPRRPVTVDDEPQSRFTVVEVETDAFVQWKLTRSPFVVGVFSAQKPQGLFVCFVHFGRVKRNYELFSYLFLHCWLILGSPGIFISDSFFPSKRYWSQS